MTRVKHAWSKVSTSLWLVPAAITVASIVLAVVTIWLDQRQVIPPDTASFILIVGSEGARGVLGTIAGSIITVTGVVFSITIVVLQLASSQFSPRVLRSFTGDRRNQLVLGVFIGTFTYSLLVLRTVRSSFDDYDRFVPSLSVNIAVLLALVSIGFLIYFINHIAQSLQAETIIARVTQDALAVVDKLFPEQLGEAADGAVGTPAFTERGSTMMVEATEGGYVQSVDEDAIMRFAKDHNVVLRMEYRIGAFVIAGDPLIAILGSRVDQHAADKLRGAVQLGSQRTHSQDIERGIIELTDIAVRALSPGINDPTTALVCIDRLTEILAALGMRRFPDVVRQDTEGNVRVIAKRVEYEDLVSLAFTQLREHGYKLPTIMNRSVGALERLQSKLGPQRRAALQREIAATKQAALSAAS